MKCVVLATVDRKPITKMDVLARFLFWPKIQQLSAPKELFSQYAPSILRQILLERLQLALAEQHKIVVPEAQLNQASKAWIEDLKKNAPALVLTALDIQSIHEQIKSNMHWDYYIEGRYGAEFQITAQEISLYKKQWKKRPSSLKQIRYGEIVLFYKANPEEALKEMQNIKNMLDQGSPFGQVAFQFSQSESKKSYGIVEWVPEHTMDPTLLNIIAQSPEGQISGPYVIPNLRAVICVVLLGRKTQGELGGKCPSDNEIRQLLRQERKGIRVRREINNLLNGENYEVFDSAQKNLENSLDA